MGFILDGLDTEDYDRQYSDRELLQRILSYFKPYTRQMALVAAMISLYSLAGTGGPILIAKGIDILETNATTQVMLLLSGGVLLLGVSAWFFNFIQQYFSAKVSR
ncbi:MAG: hypothetical protein H6661_11475 [Ardenticatenaceae bacterium]|nr:hypothetical protein [Ardenticatenaceae bacterium]